MIYDWLAENWTLIMHGSRCARQQRQRQQRRQKKVYIQNFERHFFLVGHHFTAFLLISAFVFDGTAKSFPFLFSSFFSCSTSDHHHHRLVVVWMWKVSRTVYLVEWERVREKIVIPVNRVRTRYTAGTNGWTENSQVHSFSFFSFCSTVFAFPVMP